MSRIHLDLTSQPAERDVNAATRLACTLARQKFNYFASRERAQRIPHEHAEQIELSRRQRHKRAVVTTQFATGFIQLKAVELQVSRSGSGLMELRRGVWAPRRSA